MWRTQKPWELETSKQEEMSRLPIFASQHDVCLKLKQMLKKLFSQLHFHNTQHSSVVFFFLCLCFYFDILWPKTEEVALVAVVRQYIVICGYQLAFGKRDRLLLRSPLYTNCAVSTNRNQSKERKRRAPSETNVNNLANYGSALLPIKKNRSQYNVIT